MYKTIVGARNFCSPLTRLAPINNCTLVRFRVTLRGARFSALKDGRAEVRLSNRCAGPTCMSLLEHMFCGFRVSGLAYLKDLATTLTSVKSL